MMLHCLSWWWCKPDAIDQWLLGWVQHINMFCLSCKAAFKKLNDLSKFLNWKILLKSPLLGCSWKFRWSGNSKPIFPRPASAGPEQALWALDRVCVSRFLIPTWSPSLIHNTFPPTPEGIWIHDRSNQFSYLQQSPAYLCRASENESSGTFCCFFWLWLYWPHSPSCCNGSFCNSGRALFQRLPWNCTGRPYLDFLHSTESQWRDEWNARGSTSLAGPHLGQKRHKEHFNSVTVHNECFVLHV